MWRRRTVGRRRRGNHRRGFDGSERFTTHLLLFPCRQALETPTETGGVVDRLRVESSTSIVCVIQFDIRRGVVNEEGVYLMIRGKTVENRKRKDNKGKLEILRFTFTLSL